METQELPANQTGATPAPDPEVEPRPGRRTYNARFKLQILKETDSLPQGEIGAYLRRKGLYWSNLTTWRRQREQGQLAGLSPKKRGPAPKPEILRSERLAQLERENARLRCKLERAEKIIEVQKKLAELLGLNEGPNGTR
jgi:transposase